jgi:hypothetical protein
MNPTLVSSLLSLVPAVSLMLSPYPLAIAPLGSEQFTVMRCTYLAIPEEFGSIQNQPDSVRGARRMIRPLSEP